MTNENTGFHLPHNAIIPDEVKFIISLIDTNKEYYLYDELKAMMFEEEIKQHKFEIFHSGMYNNFQNDSTLKNCYLGILDGSLTYKDIKRKKYSQNKDLNGVWNEQARDYFEFMAFTGLMPSYYKGLCSSENEKRYYVSETLKKYKNKVLSYQDILFNMKFRNASKNYESIEQYNVKNRPFVSIIKIIDILKKKGIKKIDGHSLSYMVRTLNNEEDLKKPEYIDRIKKYDFSNKSDAFRKEIGRGTTFLKRHISEGLNIPLCEGKQVIYDISNFDISNYNFKERAVFIGEVYGNMEVTPLFLKYLSNPQEIDDENIKKEMIELELIKDNHSLVDFNIDTDLMDRNLVMQYLNMIPMQDNIYSERIESTELFRIGKDISESGNGTKYEQFLFNVLKDKFGESKVTYLGANTVGQRLSDIMCDIMIQNDDVKYKLKIIIEAKSGSAITAFDERKEKDNIMNTLADRRYSQEYDGVWYMVVDSNKIPSVDKHGGFRQNNNQVSFKQKLLRIQSLVMPATTKLTMVTAFSYVEFMKFIDSINYNPNMDYITKIQAPDFWTWSNKFVGTSYVTIRS